MPQPPLVTFQDAVERLNTTSGSNVTSQGSTKYRQAILDAYEQILQERPWRYYWTPWRIQMKAAYSTGTITYTHSTRTLTLASGSWPTWAADGHLLIKEVVSRVTSSSGADLILDPTLNPGADVAAGTSFTIYQKKYNLPFDFLGMKTPHRELGPVWWMNYVQPDEAHSWERRLAGSFQTWKWTVVPNPEEYARMCIEVFGWPTEDESLDFIYYRRGRDLRYSGEGPSENTGTIAGTVGSTAITGTGTAWTSDMIGSILRLSASTTAPTGTMGSNPFQEQKVITAVSGPLACTVDSDLVNTYTNEAMRVSDPIDIFGTMMQAFWACCEWKLRLSRSEKDADQFEQRYYRALNSAFESEADMVRESPDANMALWYGAPLHYWGNTSF